MAFLKRATLIGALGSGLLLVGCSLGPTRLNTPASAAPDPPGTQPIVAPYRRQMTLEECDDSTGSYPKAYALQANRLMADWLDQAARPNQGGVVAYINLINSQSFRPESTVMTIEVPPLPPDPSAPTLQPMPTPTGDPFTDPQRRATVQATNAARLRAYQQQLAQARARLDRVRQQVRTETDALRALDPVTDTISTSIWGCLATASARFQGVAGDKWLILASDMQNNTFADFTSGLSLRGVHVAVVDYYATTAPESAATIHFWTAVFHAASAADVHFFDPAATQTLPDLLDSTGGQP